MLSLHQKYGRFVMETKRARQKVKFRIALEVDVTVSILHQQFQS